MQHSTLYTVVFAAIVCLVCAVFVSGTAVSLKEKQEENKILDRQKKVLVVAGLMNEGADWSVEKIKSTFSTNIQAKIVELKSGSYSVDMNASSFDQRKASKDPLLSTVAPSLEPHGARAAAYAETRLEKTGSTLQVPEMTMTMDPL